MASWWKNKVFSSRVGKVGGIKEGITLDTSRLPSTVQKRFERISQSSKVDTSGSLLLSHKLFRSRETKGVANTDFRPPIKTVYNRDGSGGTRVFLQGLSSAQKVGGVAVGDRSFAIKPVVSPGDVQDGHLTSGEASFISGNVGHDHRSVRCVPPYPNSPVISEVSVFSGGQEAVQVSGASVRVDVRPMDLHRGGEATKEMGISQLSDSLSVSGRLVESASREGSIGSVNASAGTGLSAIGVTGKCTKIRTGSSPKDCVSGGAARSTSRSGICNFREARARDSSHSKVSAIYFSASHKSGVDAGVTGLHIFHGHLGQDVFSKIPVPGAASTTEGEIMQQQGGVVTTSERSSQVLAAAIDMADGCAVSVAGPTGGDLHGCVTAGVGDSLRPNHVSGQVAEALTSHKLSGVEDSVVCSPVVSAQVQKPGTVDSDRQYHSSSVSVTTGGHSVSQVAGTIATDSGVSTVSRMSSDSQAHPRQAQRVGGLGVQGESSSAIRMGPIPRGFRMGTTAVSVGQSVLGDVCQFSESSSNQVCLSLPGSSSLGGRCDDVRASSGRGNLCVPTVVSNCSVSPTSVATGQVQSAASGTVVSSYVVASGTQPVVTSQVEAFPSVTPVAGTATLGSCVPQSGKRQSIPDVFGEGRLKALGYTDQVIRRLALSHAASTQKQYLSKWTLFVVWASEKKPLPVDPTTPSMVVLADFLTYLFEVRKISPGAINNYRSAIVFYWRRLGFTVSPDDRVIKDLLSGFKRERPPPRTRVMTWDLKLVLEFFRSGRFAHWDSLSPKDLTLKAVFLVALASGKRRGELHALVRQGLLDSHGDREGIIIHPAPDFISKTHIRTQGLGALKEVFIPKLVSEDTDSTLLCPVATLRRYLQVSDAYRSPNQKKLFISWQEGISADIAPQTISSYIRKAILLAYTEADQELLTQVKVVPHSVRHVATSLNALKHFSLQDIMRAGAWSTPNTFISFYLRDFATDTISGLSSIGGFIAGGLHF